MGRPRHHAPRHREVGGWPQHQLDGKGTITPTFTRRAGEASRRLPAHYAEVARRWQAASNLPSDAVPKQVGAAMLDLTQGFLLQDLLVPGTTVAGSGLDALLDGSTPSNEPTAPSKKPPRSA